MNRRTISGILTVASLTTFGCNGEVMEPDLALVKRDVKARQVHVMKAGEDAGREFGVYAWDYSYVENETIVFGINEEGERLVSIRVVTNGNQQQGRVTWKNEPPFTFTLDSAARKMNASDNRVERFFRLNAFADRDFKAGKVLHKYEQDLTDAEWASLAVKCGACALGAISCAGTVLGCLGATPASGPFAPVVGTACVLRAAGTCGATALPCLLCFHEDNGRISTPGGGVQVTIGTVTVCMRNDVCWCDIRPDECFSPGGGGSSSGGGGGEGPGGTNPGIDMEE
jgi:hypothetical protein